MITPHFDCKFYLNHNTRALSKRHEAPSRKAGDV